MKFLEKFKKTKGTATIKKFDQETGEKVFHDWNIMVVVFALALLVVVAFDGYLFVRVNQGDFFIAETTEESSVLTINRKTLIDANAFFEKRQKDYEASQNVSASSTPEIDPSL